MTPEENKEHKREYMREYNARPEVKERDREHSREYNARPEIKEKKREYKREYNARPEVKEHKREYQRERDAENPARAILSRAKVRAKEEGMAFDLTVEDIVIPDRCPVLGTPFQRGEGQPCDESPSLDKIMPALGYVKGNVWVISYLANRVKSNANSETLFKIAHALQREERRVIAELVANDSEEEAA